MKQLKNPQDHQKRTTVFAKTPETILVKFYGIDPISGLELKKRREEEIEQRHYQDAKSRDLDPKAYTRESHADAHIKPDSGFPKFQNENGIRVGTLLQQLKDAGYLYTGGHYFYNGDNLKAVSVLNFSRTGEEQPIPEAAVKILKEQRIGVMHLWCNLRDNTDGNGQYRLDTINLNQPHIPSAKKPEKSRRLVITGHTYELVPYEPTAPTTATTNEATAAV